MLLHAEMISWSSPLLKDPDFFFGTPCMYISEKHRTSGTEFDVNVASILNG